MLMAALVVWLGSGISILQCLHTGALSMAMLADVPGDETCQAQTMGMAETPDCCKKDSQKPTTTKPQASNGGCMRVLTLKLSPTPPASTLAMDLQPLPSVVCLLPIQLAELPKICVKQYFTGRSHYAWHSPPRDYLHLIRVLLI